MKKQDTIDLHGLHTREALHALMNFLDNAHRSKFQLYLFNPSVSTVIFLVILGWPLKKYAHRSIPNELLETLYFRPSGFTRNLASICYYPLYIICHRVDQLYVTRVLNTPRSMLSGFCLIFKNLASINIFIVSICSET